MVNFFKSINEILLKKNNLRLRNSIFEKKKHFYSIKIVDTLKNKNVKVYDDLIKKKKKVEKEKDKLKKEESNLMNTKNDLYELNKNKTIFYESERIIKCVSGNGGDGTISFKKYKRKVFGVLGLPNGGKGGNGGSIYLCYLNIDRQKKKSKKANKNDLNKHLYINNLNELPCVLSATNGEKGKSNQLRGKCGSNIFIYLNKICHVYKLFPDTDDNSNVNSSKKESLNNHSENDISENKELNNHNTFDNDRISGKIIQRLNSSMNKESMNNNNLIKKNLNESAINYSSNYEENVYNILKKNDPVYIKRNNHILKEIMNFDKKITKEIYLGLLNENNDCILLSRGGVGGKGNNMKDTFSYEKGEKGETSYIKIVCKCISDICFIGYSKSGKSTLLSLITHKIYTVNNLYILKKIYFKDNFQISVADFFNCNDDLRKNKNEENISTFYINQNLFKYLELTHLIVIVLDFNHNLITQFYNIREEMKKDEKIYRKPYIVVINKCDINFKENIKKAEDSFNEIKTYDNNVSIFFISAKYAIGINEFVSCLRNFIQKLKQKN
ncbi:GTP-binding protein, putative [Plasmodium gallinaceum]|uniref:GTP-binding protein, putative n=1 Tax=Plasmodium gallinaceum TaxID=5849 RepID=A0A1J1GRJ1_PLAGA|nr:GTP-binding protein, putative [Plasmodium gallinaceum]CRG93658.1 GTP-binding protein, putative [Plasmodium gallinaceum]